MVQAVAKIPVIEAFNVEGNKQRRDHDDRHVPAQLRVLPRQIKFSAQQEEIDREIHAEQRHEDRRDRLRVGAVGGEGVVSDGEAARARRAERVAERIKQRVAARQIQNDLHDRQAEINAIQNFRRIDHARDHLGHRRSWAFGAQQMNGLSAVHADDGQHEYENAHAADPV